MARDSPWNVGYSTTDCLLPVGSSSMLFDIMENRFSLLYRSKDLHQVSAGGVDEYHSLVFGQLR